MSVYVKPNIYTFKAAAAIEAYRFVKFDNAETVSLAVAGERPCGVAMSSSTNANDPIEVSLFGGGGKVTLGATVGVGKFVMPDAAGKAVLGTADTVCMGYTTNGGVLDDIVGIEVSPCCIAANET